MLATDDGELDEVMFLAMTGTFGPENMVVVVEAETEED